jgi:hypothetical protein
MADEVPTQDLVWQQGEDGEIDMVYKINGTPVDLTGYLVRMDVTAQGSSTVLFTFNSETADTGGETESGDEATVNDQGEIYIVVPRSASLSGGQLFNYLDTALDYDVFLRNTSNKQKKILKGTITIQKSVTLWT